jgi:ABC-type transport system involved in multi-copper enzyme maturation permease subunit
MLGPIFHIEMLLGGRRGRQYWFRWFVAGMLILFLLFHYVEYMNAMSTGERETGRVPPTAASNFATDFVYWVIVHQILIILLAGPVVTAGAVTDEKTRGTLLYLFSADLNAWEILVGKLLGRMYEVFLLILVTLPFMCFIGVWGGLTPLALLVIMLSLLGPIFAIGSASLLFSVWCRQTRDAVVGMFAVGGILALVWFGIRALGGLGPSWSGLRTFADYFHPMHVAAPALTSAPPREMFAHLLATWIAWGLCGAAAFGVAVWRLRGAYLKQLEHSGKQGVTAMLAPKRVTVSDEPLTWKERHVDGIAPLSLLKFIPRWFALPGIVILTISLVITLVSVHSGIAFVDVLTLFVTFDLPALRNLNPVHVNGAFFSLGIIVLVVASLVVGIRCSGTISGEREKQTWEALLLTPLETPSLIRNKLWGILGASVPYVLAYTLPALTMATMVGPEQGWVMMGAVATFLVVFALVFRKRLDSLAAFGVALVFAVVAVALSVFFGGASLFLTLLTLLVTIMSLFYMGGAGVWSSVRCSTSWRSLLVTLGIGYVGGLILWVVTLPVTAIVAFFVYMIMEALAKADALLGTQVAASIGKAVNWPIVAFIASCIVLAGVFLGVPWWFLKNAEHRVGHTERTRIWKAWEEPRPRRKRRIRKLKQESQE